MTITSKPLNDAPKSDLQTFDFSGLELRILMMDGEPWFVGSDILHILFGAASGKGMAYRTLSADQMTKVNRADLGMKPGRRVNLLSESGLYHLIMRSDKAEARKFQDWVTRDVLPAIRKTGGYLLNEEARAGAKADDRQG